MPDEFMPGHLARFAYINGFSSSSTFITELTSHSREACKNGDPLEIYQRFCSLLMIDSNNYLGKHTMLPIERMAALEETMIDSYEKPRITHHQSILMKLNERAFFCVTCAEEDVIQHGFSYWRRTHQIHGINWCIHHGTDFPLSHVSGFDGYEKQPHSILNAETTILDGNNRSEFIIRYAEISAHILTASIRYPRKHLASVINTRIISSGFVISQHSEKFRISDICRDLLPADWLSTYFKSIHIGQHLKYCPAIDAVSFSMQGISGYSYILALSVIFNDKLSTVKALETKFESALQITRQEKIDKSDHIIQLYFEFGGNHSFILKSTSYSSPVVYKTLKCAGLPSLSYVDESVKYSVLKFLKSTTASEMILWKSLLEERRHRLSSRSVKINTKALAEVLEIVSGAYPTFSLSADAEVNSYSSTLEEA